MRRWLLAVAVALVSCSSSVEPRGQVLLYVDTDAPVPNEDDGPEATAALFDSMAVEVFEPGESLPCDKCRREFALQSQAFSSRKVSLGIPVVAGVSGYRARITLFRHASRPASNALPVARLETTVALPITQDTGVVEHTVFLSASDVGVPVGTPEAPSPGIPGAPDSSRVGTWPGARRIPCSGDPLPGEACVPGGAFWMGTPFGGGTERLVVLSPFFVDTHEMTVAELRPFVTGTPDQSRLLPWSGESSGVAKADFCTFTISPGANEELPANCVQHAFARETCVARGKDLPTEAQYEYVARGLVSNPYPWGKDDPGCGDVVFGRGGYGAMEHIAAPCKPPTPPGGPAERGTGIRDRFELPTGTVFDLVGNVSELVLDDAQPWQGPCWKEPKVLVDPVCVDDSAPEPGHMTRGSGWYASVISPVADARSQAASLPSPFEGFRCVRRAAP